MARKGLLGSGSKGRQRGNIAGAPTVVGLDPVNPAVSVVPAETADRVNIAHLGTMLRKEKKRDRQGNKGLIKP